ncbi:LCP family protein [Microbacterium sp. YY-01]|uniref:LCP family protein n=1 Tax=Microbacterium sp. YY-01 TaxID=3421634 RepID=UPI003D1670AF
MRLLGVAMAVVLVSGATVAAYVAHDLSSAFAEGAVALDGQDDLPPDIGAFEGGVNIMLIGSDECEEGYIELFGDRCEDDDGGARNDVNMLVHISDEPRKVTVVTFPRDLMVPIPECTDENGEATWPQERAQINTALETGGINCVVNTISELSGEDIQFAAKLTWLGVIEITNAIGGVEVCVANGITDEHTELNLTAGTHQLQGWEALQFMRTRYGVGDGSDLGRVSNQQVYMSALARKMVSKEVLTNPATLLKLARTTLENVTPSQSLTNPMTLAQIGLAVKDVPFSDMVFVQYPVFDDPYDENRVVPDYESAEALWNALNENQSLEVTGKSDSVIVADDDGTVPEPPGDGLEIDESESPSPAPSPSDKPGVAVLPDTIKGTNADEVTCSNGVGFWE